MEFTRDELFNLALTLRRVVPQNFEEAQVVVRLEAKITEAIKAADELHIQSLVNAETAKRAAAQKPATLIPTMNPIP